MRLSASRKAKAGSTGLRHLCPACESAWDPLCSPLPTLRGTLARRGKARPHCTTWPICAPSEPQWEVGGDGASLWSFTCTYSRPGTWSPLAPRWELPAVEGLSLQP